MKGNKMKRAILLMFIICLNIRINAQEISPYLFGQNHWIATGDEGNRIGYMEFYGQK